MVFFDFAKGLANQAPGGSELKLHDAERNRDGHLEFTTASQYAEVGKDAMREIARRLDGIKAMSVGGWFYPRRSGEQVFFSRGLPETGPLGERLFRPREDWVSFCLGTDQHGFLLCTIHGNGRMPFPYVTLNELKIQTWNQVVVVKDEQGYQKFHQNGALVRSDRESTWSGVVRPFRETKEGESLRLSMPFGGLIGEAWLFPHELSADEIKQDYLAKKGRYRPAPAGEPVALRDERACGGRAVGGAAHGRELASGAEAHPGRCREGAEAVP